MTAILCDSKSKVDALRECVDLIHNGYLKVFLHDINGKIVCKMKHQRNGRTLTITATTTKGCLSERGKIIKEW